MPTQDLKVPGEIRGWSIDKLVFYARNPRSNAAAVDRMCGSIRGFEFKKPCLVRSDGDVIELDPKYVDVLVGRWQGLSREKAKLEGDGRTFAAIGRDRLKRAA